MLRLCMIIAVAAVLVGSLGQSTLAAEQRQKVQFRDLFTTFGKPSVHAVALSGKEIEIVGFFTAPPTSDSPFHVLVGAPTAYCPYCTTAISEHKHLPFILVYPEGEVGRIGLRDRLRVVGTLEASHQHEDFYGIHNDMRLLDARITSDARVTRSRAGIARAVRRPLAAQPDRGSGRSVVTPESEYDE